MNTFLTIYKNKIEIQQKGYSGTPIIILTGMGCSFDEWHEITETLSKTNRVFMFHRPGLGESEIGNEVRNTEAVVNEMQEMMRLLEIDEQILLVGHSYGGLCAQHFVQLHPENVKGIVLVDSTSVDLRILDELDLPVLNEDSDEKWMEKCLLYSNMNQEELRKMINPSLSEKQKLFPLQIQHRLMDFQTNPNLYKAMYSEISNWKNDAEIIKNIGDFPDKPLIIIGRDKEFNIQLGVQDGLPEWEIRLLEEKWQELILEQEKLTNVSELVFAKRSSHSVHMDRPDVIIDAIKRIQSRL
ncbi:alpha/beta hydrolase [Heyndrickxia shackletonii]|uniref:Alpha/beta hydrolase n=1 Tax=Heyndrickxia shackletonii TaxID=157838 RepID=A0A0Q3T8U5_9BACI|nr:alpha/beta hydrolase [Heyndrickxia shackletonii]